MLAKNHISPRFLEDTGNFRCYGGWTVEACFGPGYFGPALCYPPAAELCSSAGPSLALKSRMLHGQDSHPGSSGLGFTSNRPWKTGLVPFTAVFWQLCPSDIP